MKITIFCGSKDTIYSPTIQREIQHFFTLINKEYTFVYGGGTHGLMKEIYDAYIEHKFKLISVNCNRWIEDSVIYTEEICYPSIVDRQKHLIEIGDAFIVFPGGLGTTFEALQAITLNDVKETNKPVLFLNCNNYFDPLFSMIDHCRQLGMINKTNEQLNIHIVSTSEECVHRIHSILPICEQ